MKRDLDLIRDILLYIEEAEQYPICSDDIEIPEATEEMISFHMQLLSDAGFIDYFDMTACGNGNLVTYQINRLTMSGCDYLDGIRDDGIWKSVKAQLGIAACSATLEVVKSVATAIILGKIGI